MNAAVRERELVLAFHEDFPGLGYVRKMGPFFDFVPIAPESLEERASRGCR